MQSQNGRAAASVPVILDADGQPVRLTIVPIVGIRFEKPIHRPGGISRDALVGHSGGIANE